MNSTRNKHLAHLTIACLLILLTGCTLSSYNTHPEYRALEEQHVINNSGRLPFWPMK